MGIIQLARAVIEVEKRNGYLFLVETGQLGSVREVLAYANAMQEVIAKSGIDRAVIDARGEEGDPPPEVRAAMWEWLAAPDRGFAKVAFVLSSEMAVARVNMTALSRKAPVRAFDSVHAATRWLTRETRSGSTLAMPAVREEGSSSARAPRTDSTEAHAPTEPPPPMTRNPGFRPPTPGPEEAIKRARSSELREIIRDRSTTPPKGGKVA
jgi:hypothetical protein